MLTSPCSHWEPTQFEVSRQRPSEGFTVCNCRDRTKNARGDRTAMTALIQSAPTTGDHSVRRAGLSDRGQGIGTENQSKPRRPSCRCRTETRLFRSSISSDSGRRLEERKRRVYVL